MSDQIKIRLLHGILLPFHGDLEMRKVAFWICLSLFNDYKRRPDRFLKLDELLHSCTKEDEFHLRAEIFKNAYMTSMFIFHRLSRNLFLNYLYLEFILIPIKWIDRHLTKIQVS